MPVIYARSRGRSEVTMEALECRTSTPPVVDTDFGIGYYVPAFEQAFLEAFLDIAGTYHEPTELGTTTKSEKNQAIIFEP